MFKRDVFLNMKMKMCTKLVVFIVIFVNITFVRGTITIDNNGYSDILVAISDIVHENFDILNKIQQAFAQASNLLYTSTKQRAYFRNVTILVPQSWSTQVMYEAATIESFLSADIRVDNTSQIAPFILKGTACGLPGTYIHLSTAYLLSDTVREIFGHIDKVLVHEWSHLRYGVFDEYPLEGADQFYASFNGVIEAVRCSLEISGGNIDIVTGSRCRKATDTTFVDTCRFKEYNLPAGSGYSSLMYKSYLSQINRFCEDGDVDIKVKHNPISPTEHNRACSHKSVWQVISESSDFANDTNPPRSGLDTTPTFRIVRRPEATCTFVLVLDTSGSMEGAKLERLIQGCTQFIRATIRDDDKLGIVTFNTDAEVAHVITTVNSANRNALIGALLSNAVGSTSIGAGIHKALMMLQDTPGASVIVITDGEENVYPYIRDIEGTIIESNVIIHSIGITQASSIVLDALAATTGGLSFIYELYSTTNGLSQAFEAIVNLKTNAVNRTFTLFSKSLSPTRSTLISDSILIDDTLGRDTKFIFDYTNSYLVVSVISPNGEVFTNTTSDVNNVKVIEIPESRFTAGEWRFNVTTTAATRLAVSVLSKAADQTGSNPPITAFVFWRYGNIDSIGPNQNNQTQAIHAAVAQNYAPVLRASVIATVNTPGGRIVQVMLQDNGAGADTTANDGVYSAFYLDFDYRGRYGVTIDVRSTTATVISPRRIIGTGAAANFFASEYVANVPVDVTANNIERTEIGQSFIVDSFVPAPGGKYYPPGRITDLRVTNVSYSDRQVTLEWTAVGEQLDVGNASRYELRIGQSFNDMLTNFNNQTLITDEDVVAGITDLENPQNAGSRERITVQVEENGAVTYVFAIIAWDYEGRNASSDLSNIATASMQLLEDEEESQARQSDSTTLIILVSTIVPIVVIVQLLC